MTDRAPTMDMDEELAGFLQKLPAWIALLRAGLAGLLLAAGLGTVALHVLFSTLSALAIFMAAPRIRANLLILALGADWTFHIHEMFLFFGTQAGFHWNTLVLTYLVFLFDHLRIRTRLVMALLPVAGILTVMFIQADVQPAIQLAPHTLLGLYLANLVFFVAATCGIMILFSLRVLRQRRRAEQEAEARARLIADLGHELKTPLAALLTQVALERERRPERDQETLRILERNILAMSRLSRRMLDLTRLDLGAFEPDWQEASVADLLRENADRFRTDAEARSVTVHIKSGEHLRLRTDPEAFHVVIGNLLSNAIRYSPEGGSVFLTAEREDPEGRVLIRVRDEGPGIAHEHLPHVFEPFFRADPSRDRRNQTHGLGLSIARRLVQELGGSIDVASPPGRGAEFSVRL